ncbi:MAG: glycerophosphodiester phosphodiesterase [Pseudomonadales bacterium]|nr:glycerophosphodiester phosphodiesterase [Pseudomonadales bacterium]
MSKPLILGHRGVMLNGALPYQNSLPAFRLALARGDGLETDACLSRDGEIFLVHEASYLDQVAYTLEEHLDGPSRARVNGRRLDQMTQAEIRTLRLLSAEPIPTLKETLALFEDKAKVLNIELKGQGVFRALIPLLRQTLASGRIEAGQLILSSSDIPALLELRQGLPQLKRGAVLGPPHSPRAPMYPWSGDTRSCYLPVTAATLSSAELQAADLDYLVIPDSAATPEVFSLIKKLQPGKQVIVWVYSEMGSHDAGAFNRMVAENAPDGFLHAVIVDSFAAPVYTL